MCVGLRVMEKQIQRDETSFSLCQCTSVNSEKMRTMCQPKKRLTRERRVSKQGYCLAQQYPREIFVAELNSLVITPLNPLGQVTLESSSLLPCSDSMPPNPTSKTPLPISDHDVLSLEDTQWPC